MTWLDKFHRDKKMFVEDFVEEIQSLQENVCQKELENTVHSPNFYCLTELFDVNLDFLPDNGPLSKFWIMYVEMIEIMLGLLRLSREGDWPLHLACIKEMSLGALLMITRIMQDS